MPPAVRRDSPAPADVTVTADVKQRLFHSPAVAARDIGAQGDEQTFSTLANEEFHASAKSSKSRSYLGGREGA